MVSMLYKTNIFGIVGSEINPDYKAKRKNDMLLKMPIIHIVKKWTFYDRLKSKNKLWSQVKVPKLSHKRVSVDEILKMK